MEMSKLYTPVMSHNQIVVQVLRGTMTECAGASICSRTGFADGVPTDLAKFIYQCAKGDPTEPNDSVTKSKSIIAMAFVELTFGASSPRSCACVTAGECTSALCYYFMASFCSFSIQIIWAAYLLRIGGCLGAARVCVLGHFGAS